MPEVSDYCVLQCKIQERGVMITARCLRINLDLQSQLIECWACAKKQAKETFTLRYWCSLKQA